MHKNRSERNQSVGSENSSTVVEILVGNRGVANSKASVLRWKIKNIKAEYERVENKENCGNWRF